jgi:hypothetical protein
MNSINASDSTVSPTPASFGGVVPSLSIRADFGPPRTEMTYGALMPWCGRLWTITYVSHTGKSGSGGGLFWIGDDFIRHRHPESKDGTYANRWIHYESSQLVMGPHVIDEEQNVRTVPELIDVRVCGTSGHLFDPKNLCYVLGMEGELFELNVHTLECRRIASLVEELGVKSETKAHFKACYTFDDRLMVANNSYTEADHAGRELDGRLAQWDGEGAWEIVQKGPFVEVTGRGEFSDACFATGWDRASAVLMMYLKRDRKWRRYRLPKASHCYEHAWQTEWPRIREVEHERFLLDLHGMYYELSPWAFDGHIWGVRPIASHLWVHTDFCAWRGLLVTTQDNASAHGKENRLCAEPQSGLWLGKTEDLWSFGPVKGWGGPWWETDVEADVPSDPYLMTGFGQACAHLSQRGGAAARFQIEIDFMGNGNWQMLCELEVPANGYTCHVFEPGFSAHWVRFRSRQATTATAQLAYS